MYTLWKESYNKTRQHTKKQRHHFADKGPYSQSYGFSSSYVCMWELDHKAGWEPKNWYFWVVFLEKTLESPWTARRSNQSILKEISPEYSPEGLMLKLKLQYFGHLMGRADSLEKTQWTWIWTHSGRLWRTGRSCMLQAMDHKESDATKRLNNNNNNNISLQEKKLLK